MDNTNVACAGCGGPRDRAIGPELPGHETFATCAGCGELGILRMGDLWVSPWVKKPNVKPYHESPYRGGRLQV